MRGLSAEPTPHPARVPHARDRGPPSPLGSLCDNSAGGPDGTAGVLECGGSPPLSCRELARVVPAWPLPACRRPASSP
jgi:hypothetical protein